MIRRPVRSHLFIHTHYPYCFADRLPFGLHLGEVAPQAPPPGEFLWSQENLFRRELDVDLPEELSPFPSAEPPPGFTFPQSPIWTRRRDHRYSCGVHYSADWSSDVYALRAESDHILRIVTPPGVSATWDESRSCFVTHDIAGAVRLIPGIPFAQYVDGDPNSCLTVACLQTLQSLSVFPQYPEIEKLVLELMLYTYGREPDDEDPTHIPAIYTFSCLKRNDRSSQPNDDSYTGSYNLAATVEKGDGLGTFVPAVQAGFPEARQHISIVLTILHKLYRLIMPHCLTKEEMDLIDFHSRYNNTFSFGGLEPGPTAVQMNVSSSFSGEDLLKMLGIIQGSWHFDKSDDKTRPTLFIICLRLPKGISAIYLLLIGNIFLNCFYRRRSWSLFSWSLRPLLSRNWPLLYLSRLSRQRYPLRLLTVHSFEHAD